MFGRINRVCSSYNSFIEPLKKILSQITVLRKKKFFFFIFFFLFLIICGAFYWFHTISKSWWYTSDVYRIMLTMKYKVHNIYRSLIGTHKSSFTQCCLKQKMYCKCKYFFLFYHFVRIIFLNHIGLYKRIRLHFSLLTESA